MFLNRFSSLEEVGPQGDVYVFRVNRSAASAWVMGGGVLWAGFSIAVALFAHPAFLLLTAPIAVGMIVTGVVLIWSQCLLEIHRASGRLQLRERIFGRDRLRGWAFQEIQGLSIYGDDPNIGWLMLKFPYGMMVTLGRGEKKKLEPLLARLVGLTGIARS